MLQAITTFSLRIHNFAGDQLKPISNEFFCNFFFSAKNILITAHSASAQVC